MILEKTKEMIKKIEGIRKFQKGIDSLLQHYFEQFPQETPSIENIPLNDISNKNYTHYTSEILDIIKLTIQIEIFDLKSSIYNEIVTHIGSNEISNNEKIPNLLNWEIYFYKSLTFLLSKNYIRFDVSDFLVLTDSGKKYIDEDIEIADAKTEQESNENEISVEDEIFDSLIEKDEDMDLITSIRSYLISNLIADGILLQDEDSHYYKVVFYIIKNLYTIDGLQIENWEQIKENNFYKIKLYFNNNEPTVFVKEKYSGYNVLRCIDEDNSTTYYAFI